jgi:hypothetical protein
MSLSLWTLQRYLSNGRFPCALRWRNRSRQCHTGADAIPNAKGYFAFFTSPFLTPASGKIHMATTMNTAVTTTTAE